MNPFQQSPIQPQTNPNPFAPTAPNFAPQMAPQAAQYPQQSSSPQGFAPPPQAPAQAPGFGAPPAGYGPPVATTPGPQGFGPGSAAANPLAGVAEGGGRLPMLPPQQGDYVLEYRENKLIKQSNTVVFNWKIVESTNPNFPPGSDVQTIQKMNGVEGCWEWGIGAGQVLGLIRPLLGFLDEKTFRSQPGADDFVLATIRGTPQPAAFTGRRVRVSTSQGKPAYDKKTKQQTGYYTNYVWSPAT